MGTCFFFFLVDEVETSQERDKNHCDKQSLIVANSRWMHNEEK